MHSTHNPWARIATRMPRQSALVAVLTLSLTLGRAAATIIVPVPAEDLAASSEIAVVGVVQQISYAELADGHIVTRVGIRVDEAWKGSPESPLELIELGGIVGGRGEIVYGAPSYRLGEQVVVYATRARRGWQTNHMLQGKFRVATASDGTLSAQREMGTGVSVLSTVGHQWRGAIPLEQLRAVTIANAATAAARPAPVELTPLAIVDEVEANFTTQSGNPRFFGADLGQPLVFLLDSRGDDIIGLDASRSAFGNAFAAWNAVSGTSLELVDGGLTSNIDPTNIDGVHRILFNDPGDEITDPTDCGGTLGVGGSEFTDAEVKTFGGRTFRSIVTAKVTMADNWDGCIEWDECNVSEVAAHEVGHAFGLGHSSENPNEQDPALRDALMFFMAHFDDRCAATRDDDVLGIRTVYPAAIPVTITTPVDLPEAVANQPYSFQIEAIGGVGTITWSRTGSCDNFDGGLSLTADGMVQGPLTNIVGNGCIDAVATDSEGSTHGRRFDIAFVATPSDPTPTPADVDTPTPTPTTPADTPTPTNTPPAVRPCVGDCNGNGQLSINELITGVNIALGRADLSGCPSFDRDGNGRVTINELIQAVQAALFGCTEQ